MCHQQKRFAQSTIFIGVVLVFTNLLISYSATKEPYSWTMTENMLFYGLTRPAYSLGCFLIFYAIIVGHFNIGKISLTNDYFRAIGKLSFESALIHPIIIMMLYGSTQGGLYLTVWSVLYFGIGNVISIAIAGFVIFMVFEYPAKRLIQWTLIPQVSHDNLLKKQTLVKEYENQQDEHIKTKVQLLTKLEK